MFKNSLSRILSNPCFTNKVQLYHVFSIAQNFSYPSITHQNQRHLYQALNIKNKFASDLKYTRNFSLKAPLQPSDNKATLSIEDKTQTAPKLTIYQRFKETYLVYGKLCIVIHAITYCGWFSLFYLIVHSGLDVKALLTALYFPEWVTNPLGKPGVGELATVYILCKIVMVFRYGLTMYLTKYFGQILQRRGYLQPIKEENKIRNLAKEGKELSKIKLKSTLEKKIKG